MTTDDRIGSRDRSVWSIEAEASLQAVLESPGCPPLLRQTLTGPLSWQDRNRRMVRRAVASPNVAPQWSAALLALGATVTIQGEGGPTELPVEVLLTKRPKGDITALHVTTEGVCWGKAHVARTPADEPIVAAIAGVEMVNGKVNQARVVLTGVWPKAVAMAEAPAQLIGDPLGESQIRAVAAAVQEEVNPTGDYLGSIEYRRAMAGVLTRRALEHCLRFGSELDEGGDNA